MIAFGIVRLISDAIGIYDSDLMSDANRLIRVLVFAGLTWVGVKIAQLIKWLFSFQWWVYVIAGVFFVGIIILIYYIKSRISENTTSPAAPIEAPKVETTVQEEKEEPQVVGTTNNRYYCPRYHQDWSNDTVHTAIFTDANRMAKQGADTLGNSYKRKGIYCHGKEKSGRKNEFGLRSVQM